MTAGPDDAIGASVTEMPSGTSSAASPVADADAGQGTLTGQPLFEGEGEDDGIMFPVMLGGQGLWPETYSGQEWLQRSFGEDPDPVFIEGMEELIGSVGASLDDVTVMSALYEPVANEPTIVLALRIAGTDARDWIVDAVDVLIADVVDRGLVMRPLSNRWTLRVTDSTMPGVYPRTVYLKDDTAWFIAGDEDYVWEALAQLPEPDPVAASAADGLVGTVPFALGGERRSGLHEATEPLILPTLSERLSGNIEGWLVDLYLEGHILPSAMLGVMAWWGLEPTKSGITIEGYRLPPGGEGLTERLLDEVFLVQPPKKTVRFIGEEIAGQPLTTLYAEGTFQHIYSSADTIWVITDPLGERELVEEAVGALP
jgi:hypothetical protein